jgi:hypothetical protein
MLFKLNSTAISSFKRTGAIYGYYINVYIAALDVK